MDPESVSLALSAMKGGSVIHDEHYFDDAYNKYFASKIFTVARFLRINFSSPGPHRKINAVVTFVMFSLGVYVLLYKMKVTFTTYTPRDELAIELLTILWVVQSLISLVFIVYWQLGGQMQEYRARLTGAQALAGLLSPEGKKSMTRTHQYFSFLVFFICCVSTAMTTKFYLEKTHSPFIEVQSRVFYFQELQIIHTIVATYLHIIWDMALFCLILLTNAAYLEVRYFNEQIEKFNGANEDADKKLLRYLEKYSNLCDAIRQLDVIFRLFTFIMIVITIPSMVITLMMMNQRIHTFIDFLICIPPIGLCTFSFFAVTVAPARLHDEVSRTKGCLCRNKSIWFPYRHKVYTIGNTLTSHMEQLDLGVSVWGFAILSRPLILGTLSATAMMLSLLTELAPRTETSDTAP